MSGYPTHGHSVCKKSPTYVSWIAMKQRCLYEKAESYSNYGGRGIRICNEWLKFEAFLRDMGERPEGKTLERDNSDRDYCKDNCRWATPVEQSNNTRRNFRITLNDVTCSVAEWSRKTGLNESLIRKRINVLNWSHEKALTTVANVKLRPYSKNS
jgi:hypothetical protein